MIGGKERILHSDGEEEDLAEAGRRLGWRLLSSGEDFTALFAVKDMLAVGALSALREAGISVPGQVSVVGYDGTDASALPLISLTTVAQPRMEMAEKILDILCRRAEDPSSATEHYLARPELIIRGSTAAPSDITNTRSPAHSVRSAGSAVTSFRMPSGSDERSTITVFSPVRTADMAAPAL